MNTPPPIPVRILMILVGAVMIAHADVPSSPRSSPGTFADIRSGDFSPIDKAAGSLPELAELFFWASTNTFGKHKTTASDRIKELIESNPNYIEFYRTEIEYDANGKRGGNLSYSLAFRQLEKIGSTPAIHLLGQYFHDERNPDANRPVDYSSQAPPAPVWLAAVQSATVWLVRTGRVDPKTEGLAMGSLPGNQCARVARTWWASPAAAQFRDWKPTTRPIPNPAGATAALRPPRASTDALRSAWVLAVIAAGLSAAVLLAVRRHRSR